MALKLKSPRWWIYHILVGGFAILMLYPVIWLLMSSFKPSDTIFVTAKSLIPDPWIWTNFVDGWKGIGGNSFGVLEYSLRIQPFSLLLL
jgi:multiple sugar transport system permease protein